MSSTGKPATRTMELLAEAGGDLAAALVHAPSVGADVHLAISEILARVLDLRAQLLERPT